jgi:hypothetical protein
MTEIEQAYQNGWTDAAREDFGFIAAMLYSMGGEMTISWHDLTAVDGCIMSRFDNPDGSITLKIEKMAKTL